MLSGALLLEANLDEAILGGANLCKAVLHRATLRRADLHEVTISEVDPTLATQVESFLGAILSRSLWSETDLSEADLGEADLSGAIITLKQLKRARNVTPEQIAQISSPGQ